MSESATDMLAVEFDSYGGPDVLELRRRSAPEPAPGEVLVRVRAASVNPVDWKIRSGMLQKFFPVVFPVITGRDGAGEIMTVGGGAEPSLVGKRVCFLAPRGVGTWCDKLALPQAQAVPFPESVSFEHAASLPLAGISAWIAIVQTANVKPGMRILIHAAAGGVGSLAVQLARIRGAEVVATCSQSNVDFVRSLGAEAIAYDKTPFEDAVRDVDVVLDVIGGDVHRRSYRVLKRGGTIVCLVAAPFQDLGTQYGVKVMVPQVLSDPAALTQIVALVAAGKLKPCVEHVLLLADFAKAQQMSETGHARGKTVLML
ncbi:MAG: NADP-dependent oxidoreductase [Xanthobacteraceae bacterium]